MICMIVAVLLSAAIPPAVADEEPLQSLFADDPGSAPVPLAVAARSAEMPVVPRPTSAGAAAWTSRVVAGAEYLLLRPSFSNSTALYSNTRSGGTTSELDAENFSQGYSSGVRAFLGWRLSEDSLLRFSYFDLAGSDTVTGVASGDWPGGNGTAFIGPYNIEAITDGESIQSRIGTVVRLYDLELAARLHGRTTENAQPLWETAGGVGLRFADTSVATDVVNTRLVPGASDVLVSTERNFRGVGPRLAYQARRFIGSGRVSFFATGAASLIIGDYENLDSRSLQSPTQPADESQQVGGPLLVPNADFSIGGSWQMTPRTTFSAGWLLLYFGELGYSEVINTEATPPGSLATSLALANSSLFLDGAFFRLTHSF